MQEDIILEYDEWCVTYDFRSNIYTYIDNDTKETKTVVPIAILTYDINNLPNDPEDRIFHTLFNNFCCGERVCDTRIMYYWFEEK